MDSYLVAKPDHRNGCDLPVDKALSQPQSKGLDCLRLALRCVKTGDK